MVEARSITVSSDKQARKGISDKNADKERKGDEMCQDAEVARGRRTRMKEDESEGG